MLLLSASKRHAAAGAWLAVATLLLLGALTTVSAQTPSVVSLRFADPLYATAADIGVGYWVVSDVPLSSGGGSVEFRVQCSGSAFDDALGQGSGYDSNTPPFFTVVRPTLNDGDANSNLFRFIAQRAGSLSCMLSVNSGAEYVQLNQTTPFVATVQAQQPLTAQIVTAAGVTNALYQGSDFEVAVFLPAQTDVLVRATVYCTTLGFAGLGWSSNSQNDYELSGDVLFPAGSAAGSNQTISMSVLLVSPGSSLVCTATQVLDPMDSLSFRFSPASTTATFLLNHVEFTVTGDGPTFTVTPQGVFPPGATATLAVTCNPDSAVNITSLVFNSAVAKTFTYANSTADPSIVTCSFVVTANSVSVQAAFTTPADVQFWSGPRAVLTMGGSFLSGGLMFPWESYSLTATSSFDLPVTVTLDMLCNFFNAELQFSGPSGDTQVSLYEAGNATCTFVIHSDVRGLVAPLLMSVPVTVQPQLYLQPSGSWEGVIVPVSSANSPPALTFSIPAARPTTVQMTVIVKCFLSWTNTQPWNNLVFNPTPSSQSFVLPMPTSFPAGQGRVACTVELHGAETFDRSIYQMPYPFTDQLTYWVGPKIPSATLSWSWTMYGSDTASTIVPASVLPTFTLTFTPGGPILPVNGSGNFLNYTCQQLIGGGAPKDVGLFEFGYGYQDKSIPHRGTLIQYNLPSLDPMTTELRCKLTSSFKDALSFNLAGVTQSVNWTIIPTGSITVTGAPAILTPGLNATLRVTLGAPVMAGLQLDVSVSCNGPVQPYGDLIFAEGETVKTFEIVTTADLVPGPMSCTFYVGGTASVYYATVAPLGFFIGSPAGQGRIRVSLPPVSYLRPASSYASLSSAGTSFLLSANMSIDNGFDVSARVQCPMGNFFYGYKYFEAALSTNGDGFTTGSFYMYEYPDVVVPGPMNCNLSLLGTGASRFTIDSPVTFHFAESKPIMITAPGFDSVHNTISVSPTAETTFTLTLSEPVTAGLILDVNVLSSSFGYLTALQFIDNGNLTQSFTFNSSVYTTNNRYVDTISFTMGGMEYNFGHFIDIPSITIAVGAPLIKWIESGWPTAMYQDSLVTGIRIAPASASYTQSLQVTIQCDSRNNNGEEPLYFERGSTVPVGGYSERSSSVYIDSSSFDTAVCYYTTVNGASLSSEFEPFPLHFIQVLRPVPLTYTAFSSLPIGGTATVTVHVPAGEVVRGAGVLISLSCDSSAIFNNEQLLPPGLNSFVTFSVFSVGNYAGSDGCSFSVSSSSTSSINPLRQFDNGHFVFPDTTGNPASFTFNVAAPVVQFRVDNFALTTAAAIQPGANVSAMTITPLSIPIRTLRVDLSCDFGRLETLYWAPGETGPKVLYYSATSSRADSYLESCGWNARAEWVMLPAVPDFFVGASSMPTFDIKGAKPFAFINQRIALSITPNSAVNKTSYAVNLNCQGGAMTESGSDPLNAQFYWNSGERQTQVFFLDMPPVPADVTCSFFQDTQSNGYRQIMLPAPIVMQVLLEKVTLQTTAPATVAAGATSPFTLATSKGELIGAGGVTVAITCGVGSVPSSPIFFAAGTSSVSFGYLAGASAGADSCQYSVTGAAVGQLVLPVAPISFNVVLPLSIVVSGVPSAALATAATANILLSPSAPSIVSGLVVGVRCSIVGQTQTLDYQVSFPASAGAPTGRSFAFVAPSLPTLAGVSCAFTLSGADAYRFASLSAAVFNVAANPSYVAPASSSTAAGGSSGSNSNTGSTTGAAASGSATGSTTGSATGSTTGSVVGSGSSTAAGGASGSALSASSTGPSIACNTCAAMSAASLPAMWLYAALALVGAAATATWSKL